MTSQVRPVNRGVFVEVPNLDREVTAIIPTHKRVDQARAAVLSVLAQTRPVKEVVVVVDGERIDAYDGFEDAFDDERVRVVRPRRQLGPSGVRNLGIASATCGIVAFLDDDDFWLPNKLERQLAVVDERTGGHGDFISTTAVIALTPLGPERWPERDPEPGEAVADFLFGLGAPPRRGRVIQTSSMVATRAAALAQPMRGNAFEDWDWLIRMADAVPFVHVPEQLVVFHRNPGSLSHDLPIKEGEQWLENLRPYISDEAYSAACLTVLARRAGYAGSSRDALRALRRSFSGKPRLRDLAEFPIRLGRMKVHRWHRQKSTSSEA